MMAFLEAIALYIFDQFDAIWALYTGGTVLGFALVLWILDRMLHIFDVMKR